MASKKMKTVRVYVVEEQEIYREVYKSALAYDILRCPLDLLGISTNGDVDLLRRSISQLKPDVLLMGAKRLDSSLIQELEEIREEFPDLGIVLLLVLYETEDVSLLRRIASRGHGGMALFLKQSLDQIVQLSGIILAAGQGQVVLDPTLASFMFAERTEYGFFKQLTSRESEILGLLARGYTNSGIAQSLFIDLKTVEHHINSMYGKLRSEADFDSRHPRVSAARLYLEATGELTSAQGRPSSLKVLQGSCN